MLGVSLSSCHRYHPAKVERPCQSDFDLPCCLRPRHEGSAFGTDSRGHLYVHFRYGPMTRNLPYGGLVGRLHELGLPLPCYPSYRASDYYSGRTDSCRNTPAFAGHTYLHTTTTRTPRYEATIPICCIDSRRVRCVNEGLPCEPCRRQDGDVAGHRTPAEVVGRVSSGRRGDRALRGSAGRVGAETKGIPVVTCDGAVMRVRCVCKGNASRSGFHAYGIGTQTRSVRWRPTERCGNGREMPNVCR